MSARLFFFFKSPMHLHFSKSFLGNISLADSESERVTGKMSSWGITQRLQC